MSATVFIILLVLALIVTPLPVLYIPRLRQSPTFDRLLWVATLVIAFLGGWLGIIMSSGSESGLLNALVVAQVPVLPALVGAVVGALAINLPLWLIDRFGESQDESDLVSETDDSGVDVPNGKNEI